jgi:hypothetical protein
MSDSKQPVSERRLAANRANGLKSTGPRTAEGKTRSSLNALRHGITGQVSIMTEEDRAAHDKFCQELIHSLQPEGPLEIQFASSIAEDFWRLQRIRALENDILALGSFSDAADIDVDHPEIHTSLTRAQTFLDHSKDFERLTLYEQRINRSIEKNRKQLDELQEKRNRLREQAPSKAANPAAPPQVIENPEKSNANGFVFSNAEIDRGLSAAGPLDRRAAQGVPLISHLHAS